MGHRIAVLRDVDQLVALAPEWEELVGASPQHTIYAGPRFALASWRHFDADHSQPCVITVRDGQDLVGLAPYRLRRRREGLVRERVLEPLGLAQADRAAVIARPGAGAGVVASLLEPVLAQDWDRWFVGEIVADGEISPALKAELAALGDRFSGEVSVEPAGEALVTDTSGSWDDFQAAHTKLRRGLARFLRRVPARLERYVAPEDVDQGLDLYLQVAALNWKAGQVGISKNEQTSAFYRTLLPQLAGDGLSGVRILRTDDSLVAAQILFRCGDRAYFHANDHNPEHRSYSPGQMITALALQDVFESPVTSVDYLTGHADYMARWASGASTVEELTVTRSSIRTRVLSSQRPLAAVARHTQSLVIQLVGG